MNSVSRMTDSQFKDYIYKRMVLDDTNFCKKQSERVNPLSTSEIKDIKLFWSEYGIRFSNYDFFRRMYHVTGIHDPRFLPPSLCTRTIYPYYNDLTKAATWADKNQFSRMLPQMPFPKMYAARVHGRFYDYEKNCFGRDISHDLTHKVFDYICGSSNGDIIIKKSTGSSRGLGVKKYHLNTQDDLLTAIMQQGDYDFIIQEAVLQHPLLAQLNPDSVNILRITTWRTENDVFVFNPAIRFGLKGHYTDVAYIDGVEIINCVGICENGVISDRGYRLDGSRIDIPVANMEVPRFHDIVALLKKNHLFLDYFDIVAWDVTVDYKGEIVCIEYNIQEPGATVYQYTGGPFAGDHTSEFLSFLKDKKNQEKYLPKHIRL